MSVYEIDLKSLPHANDVRMKAFNRLEGKSGMRILDVGCAAGDMGQFLKERENSLQVDGMDVDKASLHLAEQKGAYGMLEAFDLDGDLETLPFEDGYYDVILLLDVLEHTKRPKEVIDRLSQLLKDGGQIYVSVPNVTFGTVKANLLASEFRYTTTGILDRTHVRFFSRGTLFQELGLEGFHITDFDFTIRPILLRHSIMKNPLVLLAAPAILFSRDSYIYQFFMVLRKSPEKSEAYSKLDLGSREWSRIVGEMLRKIRSRLSRQMKSILPSGSQT